MHHLGQLKTLDRAVTFSAPHAAARAEAAYGAWLDAWAPWTPATRRQIVSACAVARHMLDQCDGIEGEALDMLREAVTAVARYVRARDLRALRGMELLPHLGAFAGLTGEHEPYEVAVLSAIGRAAPVALQWIL